jgi:hemicentin
VLKYFLTITEKPRIPNTLQNNTSIIESKKAHLPCPASGVPPPTISWFKDGKPLIPGKDVKMLADGTLEFSSAKAKDAGVYVCVATNIAGHTRYVIEFKVFGKEGNLYFLILFIQIFFSQI